MAETFLAWLLVVQGVLGGLDTIVNHEGVARLAQRPESRLEVGLHAMREANYAMLFGSLAAFAWTGPWAWIIAALLGAEIGVTAVDEWVENRTRVLPQNERVLHVFLTLNLGLVVAVGVMAMREWHREPAGLRAIDHGVAGWALGVLAVASLAWSLRDAWAFFRLGRELRGAAV